MQENSSWRRTPQRRDEMRLVSQTKPTTRTQVSWPKMGVLLKFGDFPKQTVRAIKTGTPVHPPHVLWQLEPAHAPDTLTHQQVFQNRNRAQGHHFHKCSLAAVPDLCERNGETMRDVGGPCVCVPGLVFPCDATFIGWEEAQSATCQICETTASS